MGKQALPTQLNLCLMSRHFPGASSTKKQGLIWSIAQGLAQRGHEIAILTSGGQNQKTSEIKDGIKTVFVGRGDFAKLARAEFLELHNKKPFHLIHCLDASGVPIARFKDEIGVNVAFDVKATQISQLFAIVGMTQETLESLFKTGFALAYKFLRTYFGGDKSLLKYSDGVFVTSPQERLVLERYYFYPDARIYSVPYGIEISSLTPQEQSTDLRAKHGIPHDGKILVSVTDMTDLTEIKFLLKAFEAVAIKKPNSRLLLIGNGPRRKEIEYEIYSLALGNKVLLLGALESDEISSYIGLGDIFLNTSSKASGFETNMLIAMAQKKIVILSEVNADSFVIEDGLDGFLVRPADSESLGQLILSVFTGKLSTVEIGEKAQKKVIGLFDLQTMIDQTVKAYFKILRQSGKYRKN